MDNAELKAEHDRVNLALVDRIARQPFIGLDLTLTSIGWICGGAYLDRDMTHRFSGEYRETPEEAYASTFDAIAALPSPEDAVAHEYLTRVASAVDYATEHSIAEEYVAPLRGVSCAMTDNLLTKQAAQ